MNYKIETVDPNIINESINPEVFPQKERDPPQYLSVLLQSMEFIDKNQNVEYVIQYLINLINYQSEKSDEIFFVIHKIQAPHYFLKLIHPESDFSVLKNTLRIFLKLTTVEIPQDSVFLTEEFAEALLGTLHKNFIEEVFTIIQLSLELINSLINLSQHELSSVILVNFMQKGLLELLMTSNFLIPPSLDDDKYKRSKSLVKLKFETICIFSELLANISCFYKYLNDIDFLNSFLPIFDFFPVYFKSEIDKDYDNEPMISLIRFNLLHLLSVMMKNSSVREISYSSGLLSILPSLIHTEIYRKNSSKNKLPFRRYFYDLLYECIVVDGMNDFFKSPGFYNSTQDAIQNVFDDDTETSIFNVVEALLPFDWEGLLKNGIIHEVYDRMNNGKKCINKTKAGYLLLKFFDSVCQQNDVFCLNLIQDPDTAPYLAECALIALSFNQDQALYFINVITKMMQKSASLKHALLNINEVEETIIIMVDNYGSDVEFAGQLAIYEANKADDEINLL